MIAISKPQIIEYNGINVVRDDLLPGGSKYCLMDHLTEGSSHLVYASPVYGSFQIALAPYCNEHNKQCTIVCAKRGVLHPNTVKVQGLRAKIIFVETGYLNVIEKRAREYSLETGAKKLEWGAHNEICIDILSVRVKQAIDILGREPKEIWCAIGSGTLVESILKATNKAAVYGVQVGKIYSNNHLRFYLKQHNKQFSSPANYEAPFPSTVNYDLKAWEYCNRYKLSNDVLFWNVY
jgi:hypothetical protein